jgi:hypothetical protein
MELQWLCIMDNESILGLLSICIYGGTYMDRIIISSGVLGTSWIYHHMAFKHNQCNSMFYPSNYKLHVFLFHCNTQCCN